MPSKDIVISWFKGLSGDDRIDVMCLLLDYCLPSELRFIGTYLESAAQKDYFAFRTYESTANNPIDLSYLYLLEDAQVRRRLCLCLALLHSSNRQAAAVLFGILNDFQPSFSREGDVLAELSLLFTMSANHPAFSFHQKHVLRDKLKQLRQSASATSDLSETISDSSSGTSSTFFPDTDREAHTFDALIENTVIQNCSSNEIHEEENPDEKEEIHPEELKIVEPLTIPVNTPKVYIKELKVLNIQKRGESKSKHESKRKEDYEYLIEVSWSDNSSEKIHRCYEEMFDFQCKLRKMYPTKVDENGQPWKLPFLPGRIRIFNKSEHKGERTPIPDISEYARLFGSLPKFVQGCDHVLKFFQCHEKSRARDRKSKGSKKEDKSKSKQDSQKTNSKQNDSTQKLTENQRSGSLLSVKEEGRSSNSPTCKVTFEGKTCPSLTKQQDSDTGKEKEKQDDLVTDGKCVNSGGDLIGKDENANEMYLSLNGEGSHSEKRQLESDTVSSLASSIQGKNGLVKLNSLLKTSISVTSSLGALIPTTQVFNTSHLPFQPPVSFPSQNRHHRCTNGYHNPTTNHSLTPLYPVPTAPTNLIHPSYAIPSPLHSPITSPIESPRPSPSHSPSFHRHSSIGNLSWTFRSQSHALTVQEWLKSLRLHKYSELFGEMRFDELLKMTDKDFDRLGLTTGAKRKLRVHLEMLRMRGCFTSNGLTVVDVLPLPVTDYTSSCFHSPLISPISSIGSNGYTLGYCSDTEFVTRVSESDSASECGSDVPSEKGYSSSCSPIISAPLNGCRLSCYNCGSLGHVGGQCMAPCMDKKSNYGFHLKYDGGSSPLSPFAQSAAM